jgi:hypothetical protein
MSDMRQGKPYRKILSECCQDGIYQAREEEGRKSIKKGFLGTNSSIGMEKENE